MSAAEIIRELPKLSEADRRAVLDSLLELAQKEAGLKEQSGDYRVVDLRARGISRDQAADLRQRLSTFAEDWNRPEMDVYDED